MSEIGTPPKSAEKRVAIAQSISQLLVQEGLSTQARDEAHKLLGSLSKDSELRVRVSLARSIAAYPRLPKPIAEQLASDVIDVAQPVLQQADGLSEEFLLSLLNDATTSSHHLVAIAGREKVSGALTAALAATQDESVIQELLSNEGAELGTEALQEIVSPGEAAEQRLATITSKAVLSEETLRRLHILILDSAIEDDFAQDLQFELVHKHQLPQDLASDIITSARESMIARRIGHGQEDSEEILPFVRVLHTRGEISAPLLFRCLCEGDIHFYEASLSVMTGEPIAQVHRVVFGAGRDAMRDLYFKTDLPPFMRYALTLAAQTVVKHLQGGTGKADPAAFTPEIMQGIVSFYRSVGPGSMEEVLSQLQAGSRTWTPHEQTSSAG